jgi:hypothetical protein
LDILAPDLPRSRGLVRALCSGHTQDLVMTGPCACLSLPCFTIFLLGFSGAAAPLGNRVERIALELVPARLE